MFTNATLNDIVWTVDIYVHFYRVPILGMSCLSKTKKEPSNNIKLNMQGDRQPALQYM